MSRDPKELTVQLARGSAPAVISHYTIPEPVAGDRTGLGELSGLLWSRKGTIAAYGVAGLVLGLVVAGLTTPVFRARTSLQVQAFNDDGLMRDIAPVSNEVPNATAENYLQNEVKLLESETLASRVADRLGIDGSVRTRPPGLLSEIRHMLPFGNSWQLTPEQRRVRMVQQALTVRSSLQSQVVELFFDDKDPERAARGANSAANTFVELNRESRYQMVNDTTEWLNKQAAELKAKLEISNRQLKEFARATGLVFAGNQTTLAQDRMRQIQESLAHAEADRAMKQSHYETAAANPKELLTDPMAQGPLRQYEVDLLTMKRDLAQLRTMYTPENNKVEKLMAQIAETEKAIERERTELLGRMRTEYIASASLEKMLRTQQETQLKAVEQQMEHERRYNVLKGEIDTTQHVYETTLQKVKEAGAVQSLRTTNIRVIDTADVPSVPYSPTPPLDGAVGMVLGLAGGLGLVILSTGKAKVSRPGETALPDVPELGVIPAARDAYALERRGLVRFRPKRNNLALVSWENDTSLLTESFRAALSSILFGGSTKQVLVVTSLNVMEGKTTVLSNLGIASAERNRKVLLIDADLRRPRLHNIFEVPNKHGLSDLLTPGKGHPEAVPQPTRIPNLWVLPAGPTTDAKSLYGSELQAALERFRGLFDLIYIDTPPMIPYSDGRILGRISDGVVLVIRANESSREELRAAHLRLMQDGIPVVGTILNQWKMDPGEVRNYSKYYLHYQRRQDRSS